MNRDWFRKLALRGSVVDDRVDAIRERLRRRAGGQRRLQVLPYRAFGNQHEIFVHGRVLLESKPHGSNPGSLQNLIAMYRRFNSREVPGQRVRIRIEEAVAEVISDREGYFQAVLPNYAGLDSKHWKVAEYELENGQISRGRVFMPSLDARFGIISDIDDTIVVSNATNLPKLAMTLLFKEARARVAFPDVAAFYRALSDSERNPIFYVSSGPWNLYDLLIDFMKFNEIPPGPLFLQDYGWERDRFISAGHHTHKLEQIKAILTAYPQLPFILIGDSGQQDPEIYGRVLAEVPTRVLTVYIRDVSKPARDAEMRLLCEEAKEQGSDVVFVQSSLEAARHAAARGFISAEAAAAFEERSAEA